MKWENSKKWIGKRGREGDKGTYQCLKSGLGKGDQVPFSYVIHKKDFSHEQGCLSFQQALLIQSLFYPGNCLSAVIFKLEKELCTYVKCTKIQAII